MKNLLNRLALNLLEYCFKNSLIVVKRNVGYNIYGDFKIEFEKDILKLLKKWDLHPNGKGIQKIEIVCGVHKVPEVKLVISKYWDDKKI